MGVIRFVALVGVILCVASAPAAAQPPVFTGMLTAHIGAIAKGDVPDATVTPGVSLAALDESGFGAEADVSHAGDFDATLFTDSSITTAMLNFTYMYPHPRLRPYMVVGAGVLRVRVVFPSSASESGQTDTAWSAGGGVIYMLNEGLGLRGDVRYFRHFGSQPAIPFGSNGVLDFIRTSVGVTLSWPITQ